MKFVKYWAIALTLLVAATAFASVNITVGSGQHSLPYCGGTVEVNNGGNDNQLNIVFRRVKKCSNIEFNGRHYEINGPEGTRGGSFTILMADDRRSGEHTQFVKLRSDSGNTYENIYVHYRISYR